MYAMYKLYRRGIEDEDSSMKKSESKSVALSQVKPI